MPISSSALLQFGSRQRMDDPTWAPWRLLLGFPPAGWTAAAGRPRQAQCYAWVNARCSWKARLAEGDELAATIQGRLAALEDGRSGGALEAELVLLTGRRRLPPCLPVLHNFVECVVDVKAGGGGSSCARNCGRWDRRIYVVNRIAFGQDHVKIRRSIVREDVVG